MPADYRRLNFENPTKSSGVTASQSDPDFYKFCQFKKKFAPIQNGGV